MQLLARHVGVLPSSAAIFVEVTGDRQQTGFCFRIIQRAFEAWLVAPYPLAVLQARKHLASFIIGEVDAWNPARAAFEELDIASRREIDAGINVAGALRPNVDFPKSLDIDHRFDVENRQFFVPAK